MGCPQTMVQTPCASLGASCVSRSPGLCGDRLLPRGSGSRNRAPPPYTPPPQVQGQKPGQGQAGRGSPPHPHTCCAGSRGEVVLIGSFSVLIAHYFYREQFLSIFLVTQGASYSLSCSGRYKYISSHVQARFRVKIISPICIVGHRCELPWGAGQAQHLSPAGLGRARGRVGLRAGRQGPRKPEVRAPGAVPSVVTGLTEASRVRGMEPLSGGGVLTWPTARDPQAGGTCSRSSWTSQQATLSTALLSWGSWGWGQGSSTF